MSAIGVSIPSLAGRQLSPPSAETTIRPARPTWRGVDVAQRTGPGRVGQEPALAPLELAARVELPPAPAAVAAPEEPGRLGSGQDRAGVERVDAQAAEGRGSQPCLDPRPA